MVNSIVFTLIAEMSVDDIVWVPLDPGYLYDLKR
jgi:hypothetical protein